MKDKLNFIKSELVQKWQYLHLVVLPLLIFFIEEAYYKQCNIGSSKKAIVQSHIVGYVIVCIFYIMLFGMTKSAFRATVTLSSIVSVLMIVNQLKIAYSSNPVFLRDIGFISSPGTFADILKENIWEIVKPMAVSTLLMIGVFVLICIAVKKFNVVLENKKIRIGFSVAGVLFFALMLLPIKPVNDFMIKSFYTIDVKNNKNTVSNVKYYYQHSFFSGLLGEYLTTMLKEPEGYDKDRVDEMLKTAKDTDDSLGKPNIIMVFSESLFDMTVIDEVEFNVDVLENFHKLSEEGMLVQMISPSFGGISSNPEYEMLTGGSMKFLPNNFITYMNLYTSDKYMNATSIIGELNNNGYDTEIYTCWSKDLFNVENVYEYFGVDKVSFVPSVEEEYRSGGRTSDDYVADLIIEAMENKGENPLFYMALTAENHMPYTEGKYEEYDIEVTNSTLTSEETAMVKSYAQGTYNADKQLKKLYDYIKTVKEPTMIVFYGDHLPFLKTGSGQDIYEKLEYFNTEDEALNTYRLYNTQCLVLDNFCAEYEDISYMGYDLVMAHLLSRMELDLNPFYLWLDSTKYDLPSANAGVAVDSKGEVCYISDMPKRMQEVYKKREEANWRMFVDIY